MIVFDKNITTLEQLRDVAEELLTRFQDIRIFAFFAEMGAGKTTLIQSFCEKLNVVDVVNSPTFAVINEYQTGSGVPIFHFDFYRLENLQEALDLGCEEYFYSRNYCFIEWANLVEEKLPKPLLKINMDVLDNQTRQITVSLIV